MTPIVSTRNLLGLRRNGNRKAFALRSFRKQGTKGLGPSQSLQQTDVPHPRRRQPNREALRQSFIHEKRSAGDRKLPFRELHPRSVHVRQSHLRVNSRSSRRTQHPSRKISPGRIWTNRNLRSKHSWDLPEKVSLCLLFQLCTHYCNIMF